jgi:hypothetical protein
MRKFSNSDSVLQKTETYAKKIVCTTGYESLFFLLICLICKFVKKSMTFITSCTNNYLFINKQCY